MYFANLTIKCFVRELVKCKFHMLIITFLYCRYRHEFQSNELWKEIKYVLGEFAAPLTQLFNVCYLVFPRMAFQRNQIKNT